MVTFSRTEVFDELDEIRVHGEVNNWTLGVFWKMHLFMSWLWTVYESCSIVMSKIELVTLSLCYIALAKKHRSV